MTPAFSRFLAKVVNTDYVRQRPNLRARFERAALEDYLPGWLREEAEYALREQRRNFPEPPGPFGGLRART